MSQAPGCGISRSRRRVAVALLASALALPSAASGTTPGTTTPPPDRPGDRFAEAIEVGRVLLDVRVLDRDGSALPGLGPQDFELRVDGKPVPVEAVEWSGSSSALEEVVGSATPEAAPTPSLAPRLIVLLFQLDLHPSRASGLLRMAPLAAQLLASLAPEDRVAVLTFRSHLRLHLDFTNDREKLARAVEPLALLADPPPVSPGPFPSLAARLDRREARDAAVPETALLLIAEALRALPGSKSLALLGWGMGRLSTGRVHLHADYGPARRALLDSHTTVLSLDLTMADYHSLEVGLQAVAEDTGGFYARTHDFPYVAINRLRGALTGSYVLVFEMPTARRGHHRLDLRLPSHPEASIYTRPAIDN